MTRRPVLRLLPLPLVVLALAVLAPATSADPYWGPGYKACGRVKFHHPGDSEAVRLYIAARHATCRTARKIEREYWTAPNRRLKIVNGGSGAFGYVLLKRYPGWRCVSGAGAGSCSKHKKFAGYSYRRR